MAFISTPTATTAWDICVTRVTRTTSASDRSDRKKTNSKRRVVTEAHMNAPAEHSRKLTNANEDVNSENND